MQDVDGIAVSHDIELIERSLRRFRLAFGVAKGGEVVLADQSLRGRVHRVGIERPRQPPGAADVEREVGAAIGDPIEIMPLLRGEPRLETVRHDFRTEHADRMRPQMRVQAVAKPARHEMLGNIAMRDLPERMHAGIGAAGAVNANLLAADRLDRVSSAPCTEGPLSWICQPQNGAPSYSMMSL